MNLPTGDLAGLAWPQIWQVTALAVVVGLVTRLSAVVARIWPTCFGCSWC